MTQNTSDWEKEVAKYLGAMEIEIGAWETVYKTANENVKEALTNSETATTNLTTASQALKTALTEENGVIDSLGKELDAITLLNSSYDASKTAVDKLIESYKIYIEALKAARELEGTNINGNQYGYEIIDQETGLVIDTLEERFDTIGDAMAYAIANAKSFMEEMDLSPENYADRYSINLLDSKTPTVSQYDIQSQIKAEEAEKARLEEEKAQRKKAKVTKLASLVDGNGEYSATIYDANAHEILD
jgi:hypothetical protein